MAPKKFVTFLSYIIHTHTYAQAYIFICIKKKHYEPYPNLNTMLLPTTSGRIRNYYYFYFSFRSRIGKVIEPVDLRRAAVFFGLFIAGIAAAVARHGVFCARGG